MDGLSQIDNVRDFFARAGSAAIAFSGGVDSSLLLDIAKEVLGERVLAITVASKLIPDDDIKEAVLFCRERSIRHKIINFNPFEVPGFAENPPERCLICKRALFKAITEAACNEGISTVVEGSNADDTGDYRPGMAALKEFGVKSPLLDAGLSKKDIRAAARARGLANHQKPSAACLASRIPYNEKITPQNLKQIQSAEALLKSIAPNAQIRVRLCAGEAHIETDAGTISILASKAKSLAGEFRKLGFSGIFLDLEGYRTGRLNDHLPEATLAAYTARTVKSDNLGFARVDLDRSRRQGAGETIFGEGKTAAQITAILRSLEEHGQTPAIVTRVDADKSAEIAAIFPQWEYFKEARFGRLGKTDSAASGQGCIAVACAGTSDIAIAEEAALTAETLGSKVKRFYDIGVAGLHRLLENADELGKAKVVIAVAGMEGALPSVIGGIVPCPVIAVPTSIGYGASFGGIAALLAMLNSCAAGVAVVNIDNGFGAGVLAHRINTMGGAE